MTPLVFLFVCVVLVNSAELSNGRDNVREEKLRSGLIDAFQNIKKASAKGGIDDESPLTSDLVGSMIQAPNTSRDEKSTTEDSFDLFADDDGLSFAVNSKMEDEQKQPTTEKAHNVQHIVKTTKLEKTTSKPNKDVFGKLNDSIRSAVNESRMALKRDGLNMTQFTGIESMLRVFDAEILMRQWRDLQGALTGECKKEMQMYVDGLHEKRLWALKSKCSF